MFVLPVELEQDGEGGDVVPSVLHQRRHLLPLQGLAADRSSSPSHRLLPEHLPGQERLHTTGDTRRGPGQRAAHPRAARHGGLQEQDCGQVAPRTSASVPATSARLPGWRLKVAGRLISDIIQSAGMVWSSQLSL